MTTPREEAQKQMLDPKASDSKIKAQLGDAGITNTRKDPISKLNSLATFVADTLTSVIHDKELSPRQKLDAVAVIEKHAKSLDVNMPNPKNPDFKDLKDRDGKTAKEALAEEGISAWKSATKGADKVMDNMSSRSQENGQETSQPTPPGSPRIGGRGGRG